MYHGRAGVCFHGGMQLVEPESIDLLVSSLLTVDKTASLSSSLVFYRMFGESMCKDVLKFPFLKSY